MKIIVAKIPSNPKQCLFSISNGNGYYNCNFDRVVLCPLQHNRDCKYLVSITDVFKQNRELT